MSAQPAATATACARCIAQHKAMPLDQQIRIITTEDWSPGNHAFIPRPMNQEQAVAAELLTSAIGRYWRAFGVECLGARLNCLLLVLRDRAKRMRITARILRARAEINARARTCYERGDIAAAQAIEVEPTPDYPGATQDAAWMRSANETVTEIKVAPEVFGRTQSWA
jgi:hypothetical protein